MDSNYLSDFYVDTFSHIGLCAAPNKPIKQIITIDDGTGKLFEYELTKELEWKEYTIEPNFTTVPVEPTILDGTTINPTIYDPYDVVGYKFKDEFTTTEGDILDDIFPVDYNFYEDGTQIEKEEDESLLQILSVPRSQNITQNVRYFTGWEVKTDSITKSIEKTNLPPMVCNTLDASCYTVPTHLFTSCSTDYEDIDPSTLVTDWKLYIDRNSTIESETDELTGEVTKTVIYDNENSDWELIESVQGFTFYWVYSEEGRYKINETTTDTDGDSSTADRFEDIVFAACSANELQEQGAFKGSGEIEIEANKWQLIAMPLETSYWNLERHSFIYDENIQSTIYNCVITQLEDRYQVQAKDLFKVANAYIGDVDKFYNYITGFSKETSEHNFPLVYIDTDDDVQDGKIKKEIVGFWIKAYDMSFTIQWEIA